MTTASSCARGTVKSVLSVFLVLTCLIPVLPGPDATASAAEEVLAWSAMDSGTTEPLHDVWGSSSSNVFAVGSSGTILHYDGSDWSSMESDALNKDFYGVWGAPSSDDVYAVGAGLYTVYHYDGSSWAAMSSSATDMKRFHDV